MIDYIKEILTKVSFDNALFIKELNKSRRWLSNDEWDNLILWVELHHKGKLAHYERSNPKQKHFETA